MSGHANQNHTSVTAKEIADVVKDAVQTVDRTTRNVILYGVEEDGSYDVEKTVSDLFSHAGEKPHIGYCARLGRKSGDKPRPIKVCLFRVLYLKF